MAALGVVPASRVAMDTSSLLIAFGPLLTFKAPAPKLIISDEFNAKIGGHFPREYVLVKATHPALLTVPPCLFMKRKLGEDLLH